MQAFTEGLIEGHIATDTIITISGWAWPAVNDPAGRGAWMTPLLGRWGFQLVENQLAMLLEYAQRPFERMEHRLSNLQGVASI